jgi:DNA-binding NarL/FixJ family response regulator
VAERLFLSELTVEARVRRLLGKLNIADSNDAHRRVLAALALLRADETEPVTWEGDIPYSGGGLD